MSIPLSEHKFKGRNGTLVPAAWSNPADRQIEKFTNLVRQLGGIDPLSGYRLAVDSITTGIFKTIRHLGSKESVFVTSLGRIDRTERTIAQHAASQARPHDTSIS